MNHSLIYNAYIPDNCLIPFGDIEAAAILINDKTVTNATYLRLKAGEDITKKRDERFVPFVIAACLGREFIIEYDELTAREAYKLTRFLYILEGVRV